LQIESGRLGPGAGDTGLSVGGAMSTLRRRKFVFLATFVVVVASVMAYTLSQKKLYGASAQVLLSQQSIASAVSPSAALACRDPSQCNRTEALAAGSADVAKLALKNAGVSMAPSAFLRHATVDANPDANALQFSVTNPSSNLAVRLVNSFARAYVTHRLAADTAAIDKAIATIDKQANKIKAAIDRQQQGKTAAVPTTQQAYSVLLAKKDELTTIKQLLVTNAKVSQLATSSHQVQPKVYRNLLIAILLGLGAGAAAVMLRELFDTRVRGADEVAARLSLPLIARLPAPARGLQRKSRLVMLDEPGSGEAENYRILKTNLDFALLPSGSKIVLVTSAIAEEGKSTTAGNLAVAAARAGAKVILVDLDLRKPFLHRFFRIDQGPGITDVVIGQQTFQSAVRSIALHSAPTGSENGNAAHYEGTLDILPAGTTPPAPAEFMAIPQLANLLGSLSANYDLVVIDSAPILAVSDSQVLSRAVDAMCVVVRAGRIKRQVMDELRRQLESLGAVKLGFVLTNVTPQESYGYGDYGGYRYRKPTERYAAPSASE
jgi:polysaccharide biosynthesis transport protein